eukprot:12075847-Alexandrium_andersonii.AAC.1
MLAVLQATMKLRKDPCWRGAMKGGGLKTVLQAPERPRGTFQALLRMQSLVAPLQEHDGLHGPLERYTFGRQWLLQPDKPIAWIELLFVFCLVARKGGQLVGKDRLE